MLIDFVKKSSSSTNIYSIFQNLIHFSFLFLFYLFYVYSFSYLLFIFIVCLLYHGFVGVIVLMDDYVHDISLYFFGISFFKLFFIFLCKFYLLFIF